MNRCSEAGFEAHITKPFEGETLVNSSRRSSLTPRSGSLRRRRRPHRAHVALGRLRRVGHGHPDLAGRQGRLDRSARWCWERGATVRSWGGRRLNRGRGAACVPAPGLGCSPAHGLQWQARRRGPVLAQRTEWSCTSALEDATRVLPQCPTRVGPSGPCPTDSAIDTANPNMPTHTSVTECFSCAGGTGTDWSCGASGWEAAGTIHVPDISRPEPGTSACDMPGSVVGPVPCILCSDESGTAWAWATRSVRRVMIRAATPLARRARTAPGSTAPARWPSPSHVLSVEAGPHGSSVRVRTGPRGRSVAAPPPSAATTTRTRAPTPRIRVPMTPWRTPAANRPRGAWVARGDARIGPPTVRHTPRRVSRGTREDGPGTPDARLGHRARRIALSVGLAVAVSLARVATGCSSSSNP